MSLDLTKIAETLDEARRMATATAQLSDTTPLSLTQAYSVQKAAVERRIRNENDHAVGMKMGFTSRAKMIQMGIHEMIWGRLTHGMRIDDGGLMAHKQYVHPRVESEIAFLLKKPLSGSVSLVEAQMAIEAVAPAMEIIDSRYRNFKFSLEDVVADNASSSGFVLGPWHRPDTDLNSIGMVMSLNGVTKQVASSSAILGAPMRSLVEAARLSSQYGDGLHAGWIIMAGGATVAEALSAGDWVRLETQALGHVSFRVH
jgi:2-oxo-3-hexenedioate decarboxylase